MKTSATMETAPMETAAAAMEAATAAAMEATASATMEAAAATAMEAAATAAMEAAAPATMKTTAPAMARLRRAGERQPYNCARKDPSERQRNLFAARSSQHIFLHLD
jgi:hypothetical protein